MTRDDNITAIGHLSSIFRGSLAAVAVIAVLVLASVVSAQTTHGTPQGRLAPVGKTFANVPANDWQWTTPEEYHKAVVRVQTPNGGGSGVMVSHDRAGAIVVTAAHVIDGSNNPQMISATTGNRFECQVLYRNATNDVAVLCARNAKPGQTVPILESIEAGSDLEIAGFGGFEASKLRHFAGKYIGAYDTGFQLDVPVISGDSGSPILSRGGLVGVVRGGNTWNCRNCETVCTMVNVVDQRGNQYQKAYCSRCRKFPSWALSYPATSDVRPAELARIVKKACARVGATPKVMTAGWQLYPPANAPPSWGTQGGGAVSIPQQRIAQPLPTSPSDPRCPSQCSENCRCGCGGAKPVVPPTLKCKDGVDGKDGKDGQDGADGKDGKTPTDAELVALIVKVTSQMDLKGDKGDDGKDGADGRDAAVDLVTIRRIIREELDKQPTKPIDPIDVVLLYRGETIDTTTTSPGGRVGIDIYEQTQELKRQGKL